MEWTEIKLSLFFYITAYESDLFVKCSKMKKIGYNLALHKLTEFNHVRLSTFLNVDISDGKCVYMAYL